MMLYDTAVSVPKHTIAVPKVVDDEEFDTGQTQFMKAGVLGAVEFATGNVDNVWDIVDTASDWGTCFIPVSPIEPDALWGAEPALGDVPQLEIYTTKAFTTKAFGEVVLGETADIPSESIVASQAGMSPTYRLIGRLRALFETLEEERWPSTTWPIQKALEDARAFISKLPLADIPEPEILFADDGEINFLWMGTNVHIDLGFYGTGTYSYFGHDGEGQEIQDENVLASDGLAEEIKTILTA